MLILQVLTRKSHASKCSEAQKAQNSSNLFDLQIIHPRKTHLRRYLHSSGSCHIFSSFRRWHFGFVWRNFVWIKAILTRTKNTEASLTQIKYYSQRWGRPPSTMLNLAKHLITKPKTLKWYNAMKLLKLSIMRNISVLWWKRIMDNLCFKKSKQNNTLIANGLWRHKI